MNPISTQTDAERSLAIFPAGSNGEFNLPPALTMVIERGVGCELWDTEGKHYLDFSMGWGSALVGHARAEVTEAVVRQVSKGANFAYVTEASLALAEEIVRLSPACERLRFCASGTEATMYGLRLAHAFTGRSKVIKFEGAYHGANDVGVTSLFPQRLPDFPTPEPSSAGIDHLVRDHVLIAPYNDLETTRRIIVAHAGEVAAVLVSSRVSHPSTLHAQSDSLSAWSFPRPIRAGVSSAGRLGGRGSGRKCLHHHRPRRADRPS